MNEKLKQARKKAGLSLAEMAEMIGVSDTSLSNIETGKTKDITLKNAIAICKALDLDFCGFWQIECTRDPQPDELLERQKIKDLQKELALKDELLAVYRKLITENR